MKVLFGLFVIGALALAAMLGGTANTSIGGGVLLACGLVAGGINLLRALSSTSKSSLAKREGLGLFGLGLLTCVALGAAFGASAFRGMAAVAEERRLAEEQRISQLVAAAPTISPILDSAENEIAEGKFDESAHQLARADTRLKELKGHEALSPLIGKLQTRLESLTERRRGELERVALASADAAEQLTGTAGLEAMLEARKALVRVPALSAAGKGGLSTLDGKLSTESHKTGVFSQPIVVLQAQLAATPPTKSAVGGYILGHLQGAQGLAEVTAGKCSSLYLAAAPRPGSLTDAAANAFLELSVGPLKAVPLWKAPAGSGSRTATRSLNGVVIHEGWSDGRLVEIWAGDFKP